MDKNSTAFGGSAQGSAPEVGVNVVKTVKKKTMTKRKRNPWWTFVAVAGGVFCASFLVGYLYGKGSSPRYATENDAVIYLYNHIIIDSLSEGNVALSVNVGAFKYKYALVDNAVARETLPPDEVMALPSHSDYLEGVKFDEMMGLLTPPVGVAATIGGSKFMSTLKNAGAAVDGTMSGPAKIAWYAAIAIVGGSGGFLGYKYGYDKEEKLENPVVDQALLKANNWQRLAKSLQACEHHDQLIKVLHDGYNLLGKSNVQKIGMRNELAITHWCDNVDSRMRQQAR